MSNPNQGIQRQSAMGSRVFLLRENLAGRSLSVLELIMIVSSVIIKSLHILSENVRTEYA